MTKMEMINIMIVLGCVEEKEREPLLKKTSNKLMKIYLDKVPKRLEALGRA